ncbi:zinc finger protein 292b [Periophthalmus magnuspinnatus]|uniref:zinc finger protein 292b n=1 Tax=Periophthalmus magnuspinnatus TaxID=409849 RepID=UPI00145A073C|nr:zinc finger protein 292b [Periophthalmus magnuspinnatus]
MADEEAEKDRGPENDVNVIITDLKQRLEELQERAVKESKDSPVQSSFNYCQDFCRTLLGYAGHWQIEDEPLPVVQVYMVALQSYAETSVHLSVECDNVQLVVERLALSFVELLLSLKELPDDLWNDFRSCVQVSHGKLQENGITQLSMLWTLGKQRGVWANPILQGLLLGEELETMQIENWLVEEGPGLLELRVKQLIKDQKLEKAAQLAKICSESASCDGKGNFKQMYLVCLCSTLEQDQLMEELNKVDCRDALEMICNLESDSDEKAAFTLCSAFLTRQLVLADAYCAWELTLFWSKLLKRLEPSEKAFLDKCGQMSLFSKTVYHILFLIKVIQSEIIEGGLPICIEMCIRALRMQSEDGNTKATLCKTIACLLPNDLEVKRACQLTVFLLEPTVDSYYAVETLYNEPDQKIEEEKMTVPNSLRCELLLVFKTQWPFDPEFWDWKTLKRYCLARMGPEASIVSSIDSLNDTDDPEEEDMYIDDGFLESADRIVSGTYELTNTMDKKQKNREQKKLREKGFISARFRNWQVYMQYCVLCDKEFLGHRIIRHAQTHFSGGVYSCPICAQSFSSKDTLTPHVTSHVKQSCKDRLTAMKTNRKLANPKTAAPVIAAIMAKTESDISESGGQLGQNAGGVQIVKTRLSVEHGEEHVCPVGTCKKAFKFYRNLLSHVKAHNENEEAISYLEMQSKKVVCQYCRRHFVSVNHLNDHLQVHCGAKPYICIQLNCKASFLSNTELLVHRKTHTSFKARCMFPNCGKIFSEAFKLYDHEAKHYKTFTCKFVDCGKVFHTQQQLDLHLKSHTVKKEQDISAQDENLQTPQTSSSVNMAHSICDPSPLKEADNSMEKCRAETVSVGKPETLENLLKASQTPIKTVDRYEIKTENKEKCFVSEASQIVNIQIPLQPENGCCKTEASQSQSPDLLKPSHQYQKQHVSPFEATINKMLREKTVLHSQLQVFSSNVNSGVINHNELPVSINHNELPVSNAARPTLPTLPIPAPIVTKLQAIPPAVATPSVNQKESAQTETVLRERYHCPFENCTRNYSCYKSVSKHIKTTHPELYAIRKIPRSEIRVTYVSGSPLAPKPIAVKTQENQKIEIKRPKVIQPSPYTNMVTNYNAVRLPPPVTVNQTAPQLMENVLNPIVVAQLKTNVHPQSCSQTQKILPKIPQQEQVQNLRTSTINLPRPSEFMTGSLGPKGLVESHPPITVTNSVPLSSIHLPPSSQIKTQDVRTVWSTPLHNQQLSSNSSQLHPNRLLPSAHMPMSSNDHHSMNPNANLVNSLTTAHKDMQSSAQHLYRSTSTNTVLPPKVPIKTEEQNVSLWSPASEIKHVQSGSPPQILTNRSGQVVTASSPFPLKDPPGSLLGSDICKTSMDPNPTSITQCGSLPLYKPPSANAALTLYGQSNHSQIGHQMQLPQIQKTQIASVKPSQILPKSMGSTNVPIPSNCSPCNPIESNIAAPIPATSVQIGTKPLVPANIKREENCNFSSFTMQKDSPENTTKNTDTVQNPCQPPENLNTTENRKTVRKRNKVRWPAIVRDGKWFCSRCYRAFSSSKSLGGHLSKRSACKPYDEMELNADLPASFLDLLNSDQTVNLHQNHPSNPCETFNNIPHTSKSHCLLEQKGSTSQKYQERLNGETSNDILKQIVKAANMADPFVSSHVSQFQKPCVSSTTNFQSSSVKQSIDGAGRDVCSSNIPNYLQPRPPGRRYPTPLLSQALKDSKELASISLKASSSQQEIDSKDQVSSMLPQLVHPKSPGTTSVIQPERNNMEQDIKKKLREQILAGDFQRRNNLANVCHNSGAQSPMSCGSESSSKNEDCQMNWDIKGCFANKESPAIIPGTPAEIEELLQTKSFTRLRQHSNPEQDMQSSTSVDLCQDVDAEPQQLSPSQQQSFSELKIAFERLNLIKELPEQVPESVTLNTGLDSSSTHEVTPDDSLAVPKLFVCDAANCAYNTFSSEAYWRHLYKVHNYTFEQVNAVKKQHGQYAPFQCQRCSKTFTRNPNLKAHYISAHQLSFEEIHQLDVKRKQDRAAMVRLITLHNGGAKKKRLPASVGHQELLHQKPSNPGGTSVIQAVPKANFHNLTVKQEEHVRTSTDEHTPNGHQRTPINGPFSNGCQSVIAHLPQADVPYQARGLLTPGKQSNRPATVKQSNDLMKKTDKKSTSSDTLSQYKPYRCVHQDCEAAFAIQHNLILHYRAVHQSALSALEVNKEQDQNEADGVVEQEEEEEEPSISEFRCQVKDCSRVFQQVPQLMQHYLRLHEFSIDKVGDLLSVIRLGRFTCGHEGCAVSFTAFWKYIAHIKELHKDIKLSKPENMYKCEIEGCDRAYATKSNMLRHLMKKHNDFYQLKQKNQPKPEDVVKQNSKKEYQLNKTSDGKENIESNQTSPQKDNNAKRTRKINNYWTKYEKPVLKSNVEASAMCTKSYPLQYPCMIKGCESVMNSEKSILKHYTVHGLSEKFLEQHRSHYIFCKKFPRQKNGSVRSDDSKSDPSSDSEPELTGLNGTEDMHFDDSKPFLRKRTSPIIPASLLDGLSNDDSSDGSVVMKRKRGRPKRIVEKIVKRKKMSQPLKVCESRDECSDSSVALSEKESDQPMSLAAFKPMGFEMSFLKFLEQSNKTQPSLSCEIPLFGPWVRLSQLNTKETCVKFSNRQNLKSLDKVKIVMDKAFLGVSELMLKQLQDMQPLVILEKI